MFNYGLPPEVISLEELIWFKKTHKGSADNWVKVSGTAPITLSNAIEKPLKSLVQYGKCEVSDNTIVCNNGSIMLLDDELPSGYKRIESIDFDGDFWYETGEALTGDDDVTMTLANTITTGQNVFGSYNGTASGRVNFSLYVYGSSSTSSSYFRYGEQLVRPKLGSGERTITFGKSGTSGFATDVSVTPDTFETPANAYIGMLPNSSSPAYTGKIIGNILVGTRLKYIPCERQSDGAIGYYEMVNGEFLEKSGTGTPTKGDYDTSHETVVAVVGTSEVLTIGTQTASVTNLFAVGDFVDTQDIISGLVTHKVGIMVFDGTESWALSESGSTHRFRGTKPKDCYTPSSRAPLISTHFTYISAGQALGGAFIGASQYWYFIPTDQTIDTVEEWTAWLESQYAAGTPVIVVYPLKTETTETVEGQSLETSSGTNIVDVTAEVSDITLEIEYCSE